ncbi:MAG: hypothetical protein ACYC3X_24725 [Pirellulaceae bacterium]
MNVVRTYPATQNAQQTRPPGGRLMPTSDVVEYFQQYTRERPAVVALWCLGIGFVLGWKLKLW